MKKIKKICLLMWLVMSSSVALAQLNTYNLLQMGRSAIYFDDYVNAIDNFNNVIRVKPYLPEPYFLRAVAKMNLDDFDGAVRDLSQAIELNPNYFFAYMYRAIAYHYMKKYDLAMQDYDEAIAIDPGDAFVYANRGMTKGAMGDIKGAERDYSKSLILNKNILTAYLNRALMREKLDDIKGALADCNAAIKLDMFSDQAYSLRGYLWYKQEDYHNAIEDFNRALKSNPKNIEVLMNRAIVWYEMKNYNETLNDYTSVIKIDSNYIYAYYNRAMLLGQIGDYRRAIADLDKVVAMNPDNILIFFNRGLMHMEVGDYQAAHDDFTESIRLYPDFVKAYQARAAALNALRRYDAADRDSYQAQMIMDRYKRMKEGDRNALVDTTENFRRLVDFNAQNDRIRDVINGRVQDKNVIVAFKDIFYVQYMSLDSLRKGNVRYYSPHIMAFNQRFNYATMLALSNRKIGAPDSLLVERLALTDSLAQKNPTLENIMVRGILRLDNLDYIGAVEDFSRVIKIEPGNLLAIFNRANARKKMYDYIESVAEKEDNVVIGEEHARQSVDYSDVLDDYNRCLELDPKFVYAQFNIADIYVKEQRIEEAIQIYTQVMQMDADIAEAYFNRGLLYIYIGKKAEAGIDLSKAGEKGLTDAYNILKRYCSEEK